MNEQKSQIIISMADNWPSSYVARTQIERFTGGIMTGKYLANLDSQGLGPAGRIRVGRKIAYPVSEFIQWLEARSERVLNRASEAVR